MKRPQKSLHERVCAACDAIDVIPKLGNNKYPYQKAAHVAAAFRKELFKRHILLRQNEKPPEYVAIPTNGGLPIVECRIGIEFTLTDGKEKIGPDLHHGVGQDQEGKGLYKAQTGALKYFLRGLGLIPDEADDPEASTARSDEVFETAQQKSRLREYQTRAWAAATSENGRTPQQCSAYLLGRFKISDVTLLDRKEFDEAIRWATGHADTVETLELSVHSVEAAKKNGERLA